MPYSVGVRDSMMIAHSFSGSEFGIAQQLHGATYTVDVEFIVDDVELGTNWVVDIGEASSILKQVVSQYHLKNLDEVPKLQRKNTTTEFMCKQVFDDVAERYTGKFVGQIKVKLHESHVAWASYTGNVKPDKMYFQRARITAK